MGNTHYFKRFFATNLIIFLCAGFITACGGGDEEPNPGNSTPPVQITRTLTGTAAVGAPVAGAITIKDANGSTVTTQSDANGVYSVNLADHPGPYIIQIVPNDSNIDTLYSYATSEGVTNITQFTSFALFLAYQINLADAFDNWTTTQPNWNRATLEQALATINANFSAELIAAGVDPLKYDFFKVPFTANQMGIDAFLDDYKVNIDYVNSTYLITDKFDQTKTFIDDGSINTDNYYIGALFIPDGAAVWELTLTSVDNNGEQQSSTITYPTDNIPWSEERFNEIFWNNVPDTSNTQVTACPEGPLITCDITVQVSQLEANYNVTGDGSVGTIISADFAYSVSVTGWYAVSGIPGSRVDIDDTDTWSWNWTWVRIS